MYNGFKEYLFLVVDNQTNGILTRCISASCANAVAKGILNSTVMVIKFPFFRNDHAINRYQDDIRINFKLVKPYSKDKEEIKPLDPDSEANNFQYALSENSHRPFDLIDLDKKYITKEWIDRRKLSNLRSKHIRNLEAICERHLARFKSFVSDEIFYNYIGSQLTQYNTSPAIQEWADIYGISYQAAHDELKMHYESVGIATVRINAIWLKYVDYINTKYLDQELVDLYRNVETELVHGQR